MAIFNSYVSLPEGNFHSQNGVTSREWLNDQWKEIDLRWWPVIFGEKSPLPVKAPQEHFIICWVKPSIFGWASHKSHWLLLKILDSHWSHIKSTLNRTVNSHSLHHFPLFYGLDGLGGRGCPNAPAFFDRDISSFCWNPDVFSGSTPSIWWWNLMGFNQQKP